MTTLKEKAQKLRSTLPKHGGGKAPEDTGIRLATFPRPEGELRFTWNNYEDRPYLRFQLWSKGENSSFWPVKGHGVHDPGTGTPRPCGRGSKGVGHGLDRDEEEQGEDKRILRRPLYPFV